MGDCILSADFFFFGLFFCFWMFSAEYYLSMVDYYLAKMCSKTDLKYIGVLKWENLDYEINACCENGI